MSSNTAIDKAFDEFEQVCSDGRVVRRQMIEMLQKQIPKCEISEYDKALVIQAKMSVIKTLDDLLKSDSDMSVRRLKLQLSKKDSETNGMVGQTIVALLKNIRATGEQSDGQSQNVDHGEVMAELMEKQKDNKELDISAGELEACGDAPTTDGCEPIKKEEKKEDEE